MGFGVGDVLVLVRRLAGGEFGGMEDQKVILGIA